MNTNDPCQSGRLHSAKHLVAQFFAWGIVVLTLGVGVPLAAIIVAFAVCATLPEDWQFGSLPMVGLMIIEAFPFGWVLSGLGCWVFGNHRSRNHTTYTLLGRPLECWGLITVALGVLIVGTISFAGVELR
jgi:hypothetical protein